MTHNHILKDIDNVILLGCGTSLNAGEYAISLFRDIGNFTSVTAVDGSEFTRLDIPKRGRSCAILLSQSGETKDLYRCVKICRDNGVFMIGVINVVDSLIAREVDCVCYLNAGREVGVASTKAFTSQIVVLGLISVYLAQLNKLNSDKCMKYIDCLRKLPSDIKHVLVTSSTTCQLIADYLITQHDMFVLGKGNMIAVAKEGSLKTKEIGYIHSEAYSGSALRHGPYAIIEQGTPIIFMCPMDDNTNLINSTIEEVKSRSAYPIVISDASNVSHHAIHTIIVPNNEVFRGIVHNIPMQYIAYYMAIKKGHNPDMPKNLSKCVTV